MSNELPADHSCLWLNELGLQGVSVLLHVSEVLLNAVVTLEEETRKLDASLHCFAC